MNVLVIGGTAFIGRFLVQRLLGDGHQVAILHRKPTHDLGNNVENLVADRNDAESVQHALAGRRSDVVFDNVYDWKRGTAAEHVAATARACGDGLRRYIFMSSVAVYGEGLDHRENDPLVPDDHPGSYARNKAASERALFRLYEQEKFPAVTLRPPFIYGPGNPFYREAFFWDRLNDRRPIIVPGEGRRLMHFVYVKDLVSVCQKVMSEPAAIGQAFNVANAKPVSQVDAVRAIAQAAEKTVNLVHVPRERILASGGDPMGPRNLYFGVYFDMPPITEVIEKSRRILSFVPTDFLQGLRETYASYEQQPGRFEKDYSFEDLLISG